VIVDYSLPLAKVREMEKEAKVHNIRAAKKYIDDEVTVAGTKDGSEDKSDGKDSEEEEEEEEQETPQSPSDTLQEDKGNEGIVIEQEGDDTVPEEGSSKKRKQDEAGV
jgi:hypothetical protein